MSLVRSAQTKFLGRAQYTDGIIQVIHNLCVHFGHRRSWTTVGNGIICIDLRDKRYTRLVLITGIIELVELCQVPVCECPQCKHLSQRELLGCIGRAGVNLFYDIVGGCYFSI